MLLQKPVFNRSLKRLSYLADSNPVVVTPGYEITDDQKDRIQQQWSSLSLPKDQMNFARNAVKPHSAPSSPSKKPAIVRHRSPRFLPPERKDRPYVSHIVYPKASDTASTLAPKVAALTSVVDQKAAYMEVRWRRQPRSISSADCLRLYQYKLYEYMSSVPSIQKELNLEKLVNQYLTSKVNGQLNPVLTQAYRNIMRLVGELASRDIRQEVADVHRKVIEEIKIQIQGAPPDRQSDVMDRLYDCFSFCEDCGVFALSNQVDEIEKEEESARRIQGAWRSSKKSQDEDGRNKLQVGKRKKEEKSVRRIQGPSSRILSGSKNNADDPEDEPGLESTEGESDSKQLSGENKIDAGLDQSLYQWSEVLDHAIESKSPSPNVKLNFVAHFVEQTKRAFGKSYGYHGIEDYLRRKNELLDIVAQLESSDQPIEPEKDLAIILASIDQLSLEAAQNDYTHDTGQGGARFRNSYQGNRFQRMLDTVRTDALRCLRVLSSDYDFKSHAEHLVEMVKIANDRLALVEDSNDPVLTRLLTLCEVHIKPGGDIHQLNRLLTLAQRRLTFCAKALKNKHSMTWGHGPFKRKTKAGVTVAFFDDVSMRVNQFAQSLNKSQQRLSKRSVDEQKDVRVQEALSERMTELMANVLRPVGKQIAKLDEQIKVKTKKFGELQDDLETSTGFLKLSENKNYYKSVEQDVMRQQKILDEARNKLEQLKAEQKNLSFQNQHVGRICQRAEIEIESVCRAHYGEGRCTVDATYDVKKDAYSAKGAFY